MPLIGILIFITAPLFALNPSPNAISDARDLFLKKERRSAVTLLQMAAKKEKSLKLAEEFNKEALRLAQLFYKNEGQQAYEMAESLRFSGQPFLSKYEESLSLEGEHYGILLGLSVGHLAAQNCRKALEMADRAAQFFPARTEVIYLRAQAQECLELISDVEASLALLVGNELLPERKVLAARLAIKKANTVEATSHLEQALTADPNFPPAYYWLWRLKSKEDSGAREEAEKYILICKAISPDMRRKYLYEANLCVDTSTLQDYLKKQEGKL